MIYANKTQIINILKATRNTFLGRIFKIKNENIIFNLNEVIVIIAKFT